MAFSLGARNSLECGGDWFDSIEEVTFFLCVPHFSSSRFDACLCSSSLLKLIVACIFGFGGRSLSLFWCLKLL
uniref:Uncharacterized protein n=1 Tax=Manihot esculenta TaxID=3983 RepID=A0A2C9U5J7_MANES